MILTFNIFTMESPTGLGGHGDTRVQIFTPVNLEGERRKDTPKNGLSSGDRTGTREMLQMLHGNNTIPTDVSGSDQADLTGVIPHDVTSPGSKQGTPGGGLTIIPWDMFLKEPGRLEGLLDVRDDQYISFDSGKINAFFRATYMDEPGLGDISETGDSWIITVNGGADMERLRHVMTSRVSILGMSIARYRGKWRTANKVPCLLTLDPTNEVVMETLNEALMRAQDSLNRGKHFCVELDLNGCVESWCSSVLGVRCQSLGARITLTSGEPYEAVLTGDGILCCLLCFPLWALHSCIYKIQRKGTHDDYFIAINGEIKLQGWDTISDKKCSTRSNDNNFSAHEVLADESAISNSEVFQKVNNFPDNSHHNNGVIRNETESPRSKSSRKNSNLRGSKKSKSDKKGSSKLGRRGEKNNGFENDELAAANDIRAIRNAIAVRNKQSLVTENNGFKRNEADAEKSKNANELEMRGNKLTRSNRGQSIGPAENVIDNSVVELTKYEKLHRYNDTVQSRSVMEGEKISIESKEANTVVTVLRADTSEQLSFSEHNGDPSILRKDQNFVKCKRGQISVPSESDKDTVEFTQLLRSKGKRSRTSGKDRREGGGTVLSKPKGILKELRKTKDNALSRLTGTPVQELNAANSQNNAYCNTSESKSSGKTVRFGDADSIPPQRKVSQSWISEDTELEEAVPTPVKETKFGKADVLENGAQIDEIGRRQTTSSTGNVSANPAVEGMLTNAWSFHQLNKLSDNDTIADRTLKRENKSKSFLKPKEKIVFSTDEEDSDLELSSSSSRLIRVSGSKGPFSFKTTDPDKDTETDTEYSRFRLEDVDDTEVNYLSDSHITTPAPRALPKFPYSRSKAKRNWSNVRKYQSASLPRKKLYNPKEQTLSMLSLNTIGSVS